MTHPDQISPEMKRYIELRVKALELDKLALQATLDACKIQKDLYFFVAVLGWLAVLIGVILREV